MPDPGLMASKMRAYMEALSPAARTMLVRAMRSAQERGESDMPTQAIMKAVAALDRDGSEAQAAKPAAPQAPWDEQLRQAFLAPLQPFVCDAAFSTKLTARIQRRSLDGLWTFLVRDFAPSDFAEALSAGQTDAGLDAIAAARKLRRGVTPRLAQLLQSGDESSKEIRRLAVQLGGDMALQDLADVVYVFQKESAFLNLTGQLPKTLSAFEMSDTGPVSELTKKCIDTLQIDPAFVAVVLLQRCTSAANLALLAMTLSGLTDPRLLQTSAYARLVDAAIAEAQVWVYRFENHLVSRQTRQQALGDLGEYHELVRQLELTLQPTQVPVWHRRLGAARKQMSDLIGHEIEPLPGLIRRALRVETAAGGFGGQFDAETAEDAEFGIRLMVEARNALDSLALNEMVTKLRRPVEQTIEVVTAKLMTDLKAGQSGDRGDILKAVDAAIRMSAITFGEDYAAVMRKSRDIAVNKPAKSASA